eukprot:scaffold49414_cov35-Phaeocystis_antarctica.AAC.2
MAHGRMAAGLRPQASLHCWARGLLSPTCVPTCFAPQARELFATLRWAEEQAEAGALCVLLPELGGGGEAGRPVSKMAHALR